MIVLDANILIRAILGGMIVSCFIRAYDVNVTNVAIVGKEGKGMGAVPTAVARP